MAEEKDICVLGGGGMILPIPLWRDSEQEWPQGLRVVMYLLGLGYCFMGVAIIADVFMGAIEKVTSKKIRRYDTEIGRWRTFEVWNPTVANLSLMALGSSAPEILLNVIDIFKDRFHAGELGPSTIVGSAAFNLLMIIAVCIVAIPTGEVRIIKEVPVYMVTATCSIFAYVWVLLILMVISPNVVEVWEGVFTFLFFPLLCLLAFLADKGYCRTGQENSDSKKVLIHEAMTQQELAEAEAKVREEHGRHLNDEQVARIMSAMRRKAPSRAEYRVEATRRLFGGKKVKIMGVQKSVFKTMSSSMSFLGPASAKKKVHPADAAGKGKKDEYDKDDGICCFEFEHSRKAVLENVGTVQCKIVRTGDIHFPAEVHYKTKDGEAKEEQDYMPVNGKMLFEAGQSEAFFSVKIIDDAAYEADEEFHVVLFSPDTNIAGKTGILGDKLQMTIVIIDDDEPGIIGFKQEEMNVTQQAASDDYEVEIPVQRRNGGSGEVSISYRTEQDSAVPDRDYEDVQGTLTFKNNQAEAFIFVKIISQSRYESSDRFRMILFNPQGGAKIDPKTDGGGEQDILTVTIEADMAAKDRIDKLKSHLQTKWDKSKIGHANWASQFKAAIYVNGGEEEEDDDDDGPPGALEYMMHCITVPWKLFFAIVPPVDYCDGWLCFVCSLFMIGVVTLIIGEMSSLLGCVLCIRDDITAITFVALGTSMPDLFASMTAAKQDPYADASVGNVTGSNSVNVFLGLGLPWMIAAFHWSGKGEDAIWDARYMHIDGLDWLGKPGLRPDKAFVVMAGGLTQSVLIFSMCAVAGIFMLFVRRKTCGGELGGPVLYKYLSAGFFVTLWLLYILLSIVESIKANPGLSGLCLANR